MRRRLAAAVFTVGVLAVAGCGDDGGDGNGDGGNGDRSTQEICDDLEQAIEPLVGEMETLGQDVQQAAASGDQAAIADVTSELGGVMSEIAGELRGGAADASDDEFRSELETMAGDFESLSTAMQGAQPDLAALQQMGQTMTEAGDNIDEFCTA